jgi:hypothetical protein
MDRQHDVEAAQDSFKNLLDALFVCSSWNASYLGVKAEQQRQLELQEFMETSFKKNSTAPIAMECDNLTVESLALKEFFLKRSPAKAKAFRPKSPA